MASWRASVWTVAAAGVAAAASAVSHAQTRVGWYEVEGSVNDRPAPMGWLSGDTSPTLLDLVEMFEGVGASNGLDALVLRLREPKLSVTQIEEIGVALDALREQGVTVVVFTEIYGPGELLLAAHADHVVMQQGGAVSFPGLYMEEMFLADMLRWVGVEPSFVQVGDYKGAEEMFANSEPSKAWDQNINQLLDSMYAGMREHIKRGRDMNDRQLDRAMEEAWLLSGKDAVRLGLIDAELDRLSLHEHLEGLFEDDLDYDTSVAPVARGAKADFSNPFAIFQILSAKPDHTPKRDTIAVLHIDGAIMDGESKPAGMFGGGSVGAITIRKALRELEEDDRIKGVVIRIDSPGGSAIASENIWQGVRRVAEQKPVWVSVGSMAASGGYYIAVAGDRIYVNPSSIVGSIGVVGGKFALAGVYEKLHINVTPRARGPRANVFSSLTAWDAQELAFVRKRMTETYDLFVQRVRSGRERIDIGKTAEGRLFTADKAVALRMADKVGGLRMAIDDMVDEIGMAPGGYDIMHYPAPPSFEEFLEQTFGQFMGAPGMAADIPQPFAQAIGAIRMLVGERGWPQARSAMEAATQLQREPVLLLNPRVLIFK